MGNGPERKKSRDGWGKRVKRRDEDGWRETEVDN